MRLWNVKFLSVLLFITQLFFSPLIFAWNENGHMLVAKIAYEKLTPQAKEKIDKLVNYLHQEYAEITNFPQAAAWADKLRGQQIDLYTHWHYIDQPLVKDGGNQNVNIIDSDNAVWAMSKIRMFFANSKANPYERARFLAFFVHIVGDLHQPLHTVSLVTPKFPKGDRGGNDYIVIYKNAHVNVHKLWDGGVGAFETPYSENEEARATELSTQAAVIEARFPQAYFSDQLIRSEVQQWLKEGMDLANAHVYTTPENQNLSEEYLKQGSAIAEQQVALAGYRLASLLNQVLTQQQA